MVEDTIFEPLESYLAKRNIVVEPLERVYSGGLLEAKTEIPVSMLLCASCATKEK
jgi:hypothetical protein